MNYTLKPGDTLYNLAIQFRIPVRAILSHNPGLDPYNLRVGQQIVIPVESDDYGQSPRAQSQPQPQLQPQSQPQSQNELIVFAAASLKDILNDAKYAYIAEHPNVKITYNFGGSGALQQQIEQGKPSDIFFSAGKAQMKALQDKGLVLDNSVKTFLGNKLVLITPRNGNGFTSFEDLRKPSVKKIAIGDPSTVPAGQYALQTFQRLNLMDAVKPKLIYGEDVRQVLSMVENQIAQAGVVYSTDALNNSYVQISDVASYDTHDAIVYPIGIVKSSRQQKLAQNYIDFLMSDTGKKLFEKYGFVVPLM